MATDNLMDFIKEHAMGTGTFKPYHEYSKEADALTVRFKPDADISKRLTDHVTLFVSIDSGEVVGCRIKGISDLIKDLPNYVTIDDGNVYLSMLFLPFRGPTEDKVTQETFNQLAASSRGMKILVS